MEIEDIKSGAFVSFEYFEDEKVFARIIEVEEHKDMFRGRYLIFKAELLFSVEARVRTLSLSSDLWRPYIKTAVNVDSKIFYKVKKAIEFYQTTIKAILEQPS